LPPNDADRVDRALLEQIGDGAGPPASAVDQAAVVDPDPSGAQPGDDRGVGEGGGADVGAAVEAGPEVAVAGADLAGVHGVVVEAVGGKVAARPRSVVSLQTQCESELAVIHQGLPSASRLSHRPPTVAVIQSKPVVVTAVVTGHPFSIGEFRARFRLPLHEFLADLGVVSGSDTSLLFWGFVPPDTVDTSGVGPEKSTGLARSGRGNDASAMLTLDVPSGQVLRWVGWAFLRCTVRLS
jgi:hypothetical protein